MKKYVAIYDIRYGGWAVFRYTKEMTIMFHAGPFTERALAMSEADRLTDLENELFKLLRRIADIDFHVPSEIDGDRSCWYCYAYLEGDDPHDTDCPYIELKKLLGD